MSSYGVKRGSRWSDVGVLETTGSWWWLSDTAASTYSTLKQGWINFLLHYCLFPLAWYLSIAALLKSHLSCFQIRFQTTFICFAPLAELVWICGCSRVTWCFLGDRGWGYTILFCSFVIKMFARFTAHSSLMFWTNWNEQRPSIMRSTLAGKNIRIVIGSDILTPNGLTIDHKAEKLYFSDGGLGRIERCDYDGSNRYVSVKMFPAMHLERSHLCLGWEYGLAPAARVFKSSFIMVVL